MGYESRLKDPYKYESNSYVTYEEAGDVLGINSYSVTGFANQNNVSRGQVTIRGRKRGVLKTDEFYNVIREKNYFNDQEPEVKWL